ncbi:MAG TPA: ABC transporter ATP-binding protein [Anaerolineales bacterium]|nr:ABC transporter ATP-binding protein [Anaerolineales bacterium]
MGLLIEAQNLFKSFGETKAVDGVNLQVAEGEIYGLVGPDGAGKTTTIRLLCGALRADQGKSAQAASMRIGGYEISSQLERARAQIGYLPQRFSLYEELTVLENIRFFAEVRGLPSAEWRPRCMEILHFVGLDPFVDRRAGHLSGGMRQKLGLAAALVHQPHVLLLDEPTTGVDPVTRQDFWQLIIRLVSQTNHGQRRVAVLVSTPYMDEAERCTRVGFMRSGRMLIEGTPEELRGRFEGYILELRGSPLSLLRRIAATDEDVEDAQMFGDRVHLRVQPERAAGVERRLQERIIAQGGEIARLRRIPAQLEDVFISLLE